MLPSYKVGQTRIELATILTQYLGKHVAPAALISNRGERNSLNGFLGWTWSWYIEGMDYGSTITMSKFVENVRKGGRIVPFNTDTSDLWIEMQGDLK